MQGLQVGAKVKCRMNMVMQTVTFSARVIKITDDKVLIRIPKKIREIKFTSWPENLYWVSKENAVKNLIK